MIGKLKLLSGFLVMGSTMTTCASFCGAHVANEANMDQVKMDVSVSTKKDQLLLTYEITNENPQAIYLYNVFLGYDADDQEIVDKNLAIVTIKDGIVHVKKDHPEYPTDRIIFTLPVRAYVTEVPGKGSFKETIELKLPLAEWSGYPNSSPPPTTSAVAKGIDFTIAYEVASDRTQLKELVGIKAYQVVGTEQISATEAASMHKLISSKVIPMEIPVEIPVGK